MKPTTPREPIHIRVEGGYGFQDGDEGGEEDQKGGEHVDDERRGRRIGVF
jgi:hypothetical protein